MIEAKGAALPGGTVHGEATGPASAGARLQLLNLPDVGLHHIIVPHDDFTLEDGRGRPDPLLLWHRRSGASVLFEMRREELLPAALAPAVVEVNASCLDEPVELIVDWFDGRNWKRRRRRSTGRTSPVRAP